MRPTRVVNPTPRDELYALLGLFIEGRIQANHFCRMYPPLLARAGNKGLLDDQELREFTTLYYAVDRYGGHAVLPIQFPADFGGGDYVELQAAAIDCRDALAASDLSAGLPPPS